MFIQFQKSDENGKSVRAAKLLDYSGKCEQPFELPLRENLLWKSARYADLHGEFADGETMFGSRRGRYTAAAFRSDNPNLEEVVPPSQPSTIWKNGAASGEALVVQAELERVRLSCGKCHWCANQRKRRWERAMTGWVESAPLTCFGTLTFSNEWFVRNLDAWIDGQLELGQEHEMTISGFDAEGWRAAHERMRVDRFDPSDPEHDGFARKWLMDARQKMFKRLRKALGHDARFEDIELRAHITVFEYGSLRGRLHMHFCAHFDIGETHVDKAYWLLRGFFKKHWHGYEIGFVDVQRATPDEGVESARYLTSYLLAYQEEEGRKRVTKSRSRLAVSQGYRPKGTEFYFAARPSLIPGGSLRPADPVPLDEREGFPLSSGDADREDLQLSEASSKLTFAEMPHDFRALAEEIAKANLAWRDGELWPGWSAGHERPEDDYAELPPDAVDFAGWLLSRSYRDDRRFEPEALGNAQGEGGEGGEGAAQLEAIPPRAPSPLVGEVLGKSVSERAMEARGLTPDTVIRRDGSYRTHPDDVLRQRQRYARNPADGSVYDTETGEIIDEV